MVNEIGCSGLVESYGGPRIPATRRDRAGPVVGRREVVIPAPWTIGPSQSKTVGAYLAIERRSGDSVVTSSPDQAESLLYSKVGGRCNFHTPNLLPSRTLVRGLVIEF